jgi:hypothetical protein
MDNGLNTIVAVGALSFAVGIFVALLCWERPGLEGEVDIKCPPGISRANMMLVDWSPELARGEPQLACADRPNPALQLAAI